MKKPPSKVAHNQPATFFYVLARLHKQPRNRKPVPPKAPQCRTVYLDWEMDTIRYFYSTAFSLDEYD